MVPPKHGFRLELPDGRFYLAIVSGFKGLEAAKHVAVTATGWTGGGSAPLAKVIFGESMSFKKPTQIVRTLGAVDFVLEPAGSLATIELD